MHSSPPREGAELARATKPYAIETRWLSWWHLGSTLIVLAGSLSLACHDGPLWLRITGSILTGLVLVRLFVIYHDQQHGTILQGSLLASCIMTVFGLLSLNPPGIWRRSHNHHHGNNAKLYGNQIGSFPVMTTQRYESASKGERLAYSASRHPLTIAMGYLTVFFYGMCVRSFVVNPSKHFDSAIAIFLHVALAIGLAFIGLDILILGLVLPVLVGSAVGSYLFYAQHNYPGVQLRARTDWNFVFAALNSSSYMTMTPLMHWFSGNIGYHHIHHLNPRIPFYRLPEAMAGIPELQSPVTTSLGWRDIRDCFRLKLWDTIKSEMVPFSRKATADQTGGGGG